MMTCPSASLSTTHLNTPPRGVHWLGGWFVADLRPAWWYLNGHVRVFGSQLSLGSDRRVETGDDLFVTHPRELRPELEVGHGHAWIAWREDRLVSLAFDAHGAELHAAPAVSSAWVKAGVSNPWLDGLARARVVAASGDAVCASIKRRAASIGELYREFTVIMQDQPTI